MQSSYNLIKNSAATTGEDRLIDTKYESKNLKEEEAVDVEASDFNYLLKSYENIGMGIVKNAKTEAEAIILKALEDSAISERIAYDKGYLKGNENGYEDGYKNGHEKALMDIESKVSEDITKAASILEKASEDYKDYIEKKRMEILNLALEMAKKVCSKELQMSDGILALIEPVLENAKEEENIVIKCNPLHSNAINEKLSYWKTAYSIRGEIFVLEDMLMIPGNVEIKKRTGKTIVGIDFAMKKLEELILK